MELTENRIKEFLIEKESIEEKAISIAQKIAFLNPNERFLSSVESIKFEDDSVDIVTSGYARGYYTEDISFPLSYLWNEMWEDEYKKVIEENEKKKLLHIENENKKKQEQEIN